MSEHRHFQYNQEQVFWKQNLLRDFLSTQAPFSPHILGLFLLNEKGYPQEVSGVPPELFSEDGQKWGNPLYMWKRMEDDGFVWWKKRISHMLKMCDKVRIDHFIGLVNYYAILFV